VDDGRSGKHAGEGEHGHGGQGSMHEHGDVYRRV
jgi:hypothetical protein